MTPTTAELLTGAFMTFMQPPPPESAGDFAAGKVAVVGLIALLAAQEAERGVAVRCAENAELRAVFALAAAEAWARELTAQLQGAAAGRDGDLSVSALDADNAELRRALISLQVVVEDDPRPEARARRATLLRLLKRMADGRALHLPPMPAR